MDKLGAGSAELDNDAVAGILFVTATVCPAIGKKLPKYRYESPRIVFHNRDIRLTQQIAREQSR